jgi:corrinoid protein of di/trimethylamine methyltransferase
MTNDVFKLLAEVVVNGNEEEAEKLAKEALSKGIPPLDAINKGLIVGMNEVGEKYAKGEYFVPELLLSAHAMKSALKILLPEIKGERKGIGRIVIGTVAGDIHDIGKTIVSTLLESSGFEVIDLGVDVPVSKFVEAVRNLKPDVLALSCLLTTSMPEMENVINALKEANLRDKVKIIIGGAPITERFAEEIGADAFGDDANEAVIKIKELIKK